MPTIAFSKEEVPLPSSSQGLWYCPLMQHQTQCAHLCGVKHTPPTLFLRSARSDWLWDGHRQRDRPLPGKEERKQRRDFLFLLADSPLNEFPCANSLSQLQSDGADSSAPGGWGGSRSSPSSFLLLRVLKKEKLKIHFPCRKIWVKKSQTFSVNVFERFLSVKMPSLSLFSKPAC